MENPIILILYVFENLIVTLLGGVIFNFSSQQNINKFFVVALINGLILYVIRSLWVIFKLPMGLHTFVALIIYIFIFKQVFGFNFLFSLLIGLIGFGSTILNEILFLPIVIKLTNINISEITTNVYLHLKLGLLNDISITAILIFIYLFKKIRLING